MSISELASLMPHIFVSGLVIFIIALFRINKLSKFSVFTILLSFVFLVLSIKSARYLEYFIPFATLFLASTFTDLQKLYKPSLFKKYYLALNFWIRGLLSISLGLFLFFFSYSIYADTWKINMSSQFPTNNLQPASQWLKNNTDVNSIVFNSDWDEWPQLFYFNDSNYYIVGLDYTLMYNYNKNAHKKYNDIMLGRQKENLGKTISDNFGAQYIVVTKKEKHLDLLNNLKESSELNKVYEDSEALIYKINL